MPRKLVLAVIDSLRPEQLDLAVSEGRAPALAAVLERGKYVRDCVSSFPSVTPVASATITTGLGPAEHRIPSMNWYHRGEERYVEYGSSFGATRAFGVLRSLQDTVYNMNMAHLTQGHRTVFEQLDDAGLRTACTTYLIYRGRSRHEPSGESIYRRIAEAAQFRHPVWGPTELFYADLFDTRDTGCTSSLGMPGQRDAQGGCVGEFLVEHDLFDFLLLSLPDNDSHSHRYGPDEQVNSIAEADRAIERTMQAAGGPEAFLDEHALIVMSDHSQVPITGRLNLSQALTGWRKLEPADIAPDEAEIAICPAARSAMIYVLDDSLRERLAPRIAGDLRGVDEVDLVAWMEGGRAVVRSDRGELRFAPGGELADERGGTWSVEGDHAALKLAEGAVSTAYPHALTRLWSALSCPQAGDVLLSAAEGIEFVDWGGADHVGGGSHGSLMAADSEGVLLMSGLETDVERSDRSWWIGDVTPLILEHFALGS